MELLSIPLATDPCGAAVEVEMVGVGAVVLGAQHRVEVAAGAVAYRAQEAGLRLGCGWPGCLDAGISGSDVDIGDASTVGWRRIDGARSPVSGDGDPAAVFQHEPGDVERIGGRMLAAPPPGRAVEVAAGACRPAPAWRGRRRDPLMRAQA